MIGLRAARVPGRRGTPIDARLAPGGRRWIGTQAAAVARWARQTCSTSP